MSTRESHRCPVAFIWFAMVNKHLTHKELLSSLDNTDAGEHTVW